MAGDMYLKIDGVDGESISKGHEKNIQISSFSWGASNPTTGVTGTGLGAGKVSLSDMSFSANVSKASPLLFQKCAAGEHIAKAVFTARKAGKDQQEFYKITLSDLLISSYQAGGSDSGDLPMDSFSLTFTKIHFDYKPQKADGTLEAAIPGGWDIKTNAKA